MPALTPGQAARHFGKVRKALDRNVLRAEQQTQKDALRQAIIFSSGGFTSAALRQAGHPFAVRAPNAAFDPAKINAQSGVFRAAWLTPAPVVSASGLTVSVVNVSGAAKYMGGTRIMVKRPIGAAVQKAVQPGRKARLEKAVHSAFYHP